MKHQTYKIIAAVVFCVTLATACKKSFLEVTPKGRLVAQKTGDYQLLLGNLDLVNMNTGAEALMGDEIAAIDPYFSGSALRTQRLFRWEDIIYERDQAANEMTVPMANIYLYNKVINEVMDATDGTEVEKKHIRAQAKAARAWTYFLLINYYGKPYNQNTSATDAGFPIITEADVTATKFTRATVKEVYDFIVNDLVTAIPDLQVPVTHRLRMSKTAAQGLLGKVYVTMGKFNDALEALNNAITGMAAAAVPVRLYDYNVTFGPGGSFLPIGIFGPTYPTVPNNEENVFAKQFQNSWTFTNNEILIDSQTVKLFGASDHRLKFYRNMPYPSGAVFPKGMLRRIGPIGTQFGVIVPELYLLRAESKARLNDLPGAKSDVEALRIKRMPAADAPVSAAIAGDQAALVKFILEERIREFAVQGVRWFDMRRLSIDLLYNNTIGKTHEVYNAAGNVIATYNLRPERFVLRFPQQLMDQNPGMENNP